LDSFPTTWTESYKITSFLVNIRGHAGLHTILSLIQDVGWMHARELKIKLPSHMGWVFTRQKLVMSQWPSWNESVTLRTWLRPPSPEGFLYRDYEIFLDDTKIGDCTSTFTVMDRQSRKIASQDWSQYSNIWHKNSPIHYLPAKVTIPAEMNDLTQFEVRNSDIDSNHHVNNTKYAQWILDAIPMDLLREGVDLHEYEVNFLSECRLGDLITLQSTSVTDSMTPLTPARTTVTFAGVREKDKKRVFSAQLNVTYHTANKNQP
jgi:medium-chain acyl-[acyl-carrier-protein] hydrolase